MKNIAISITALLILFSCCAAMADNNDEYNQALVAVKSGNMDFAFMHFRILAKSDQPSKHREEALFATAEYYFLMSDYIDTFNTLKEFLADYPDSQLRPFALFYLLTIAKDWNKDALARTIEKKIMSLQQVVLLFSNAKEYKFKSPLGRNYKLLHYINKIEFYLDGKLQAQASY